MIRILALHLASHLALAAALIGALLLVPGTAPGGAPVTARSPVRAVLVRVAAPADLGALTRFGADILGRLDPTSVRVAATDEQIAAFRDRGWRVTVLEPDLEAAIRRRLGADAVAYHSLDEIEAALDRLHAERPDLIGPRVVIGRSWEGRPLWAVRVSDHPAVDEDEPAVLFDALHHGREPVGMETLLHFMREIVRRYDADPAIRALVDAREIWCVPVVNPDGYAFGGPGGLWRKNRRPNADGTFGVDLNRNYAHAWGAGDAGSSPIPASATYRGPAPFSEPETAAMRDFAAARGFRTGMTLHGFGEMNLLPGTGAGRGLAGPAFHEEVAHELERLTGNPHGKPHELLYPSNGRAQDWFAAELGMLSIQPEIGTAADGFWPSRSRLHALTAKNLPALLHIAAIAGPHPEAIGFRVREAGVAAAAPGEAAMSGGTVTGVLPGRTVEIVLAIRNRGLAPAEHVTLEMTTPSPHARVLRGRAIAASIPPVTTIELESAPLLVAVAADAPPGEPLLLEIAATCAGAAAPAVQLELVPGTPSLLFADRGEAGLANWVAERGWGLITGGAADGPAFADSPGGDYAAHANAVLALRTALDLRGAERPVLSYRERIATEPWHDRCRVEAWTPERGWEPLFVHPGGVESTARRREVSLAAFAGEREVRLRFRLTANGEREADGWTVDDIEVWAYTGSERLALGTTGRPPSPTPAAAAGGSPLEAAE